MTSLSWPIGPFVHEGNVVEAQDGEEEKSWEELLKDLIQGTSPQDLSGLEIRAMGPADEAGVRHFLFHDVLEELRKAAVFRDEAAMALLTGAVAFDSKGPFVEVTGFQDLTYLFGDDAIALLQRDLTDRLRAVSAGEGEQIVGLFIARPGERARPIAEDVRVHLTLFNRPFQVLLLMDGEEEKVALYGREGWQEFENLPFFVVQESVSSPPSDDPESHPDSDAESADKRPSDDVDPEPQGMSDE